MGNIQILQAVAKGTLVIETKNSTRHIKEVMLVPDLDKNLLSVGQMLEHEYFLLFRDDKVEIFKDRSLERHVVVVQMTGNICFPLIMKDIMPSALKAIAEEDS